MNWIPVKNPENDLPKRDNLWVTRKDIVNNKVYYEVDLISYDDFWDDDISDVIAYMEFVTPEPYKEPQVYVYPPIDDKERFDNIKKRRYGLVEYCPYCKKSWFYDDNDFIINMYNDSKKLQCPYCGGVFAIS